MPRPFIASLDAGVADTLAAMRIRPDGSPGRAQRELEKTLDGLVETGQIDASRRAEIADYFAKDGALGEGWTNVQRRLDDHSRTTSQNRQWQTDKPFDSKLEERLPPAKRKVAEHCYSAGAEKAILSKFGSVGVAFFEFYADLRRVELGAEPPQELATRLDEVVVALTTSRGRKKNGRFPPSLMNRIYQHVQDLKGLFDSLSGDRRADKTTWLQIGTKYRDLVVEVAEREGVHLAEAPDTQSKSRAVQERAWKNLHVMAPAAVAMKKLREEHPDLYAQKQFQREAWQKIEERIVGRILDDGAVPSRARVMGKLVHLGTKGTRTYVYEPSLEEGEKAPTMDAWCKQRKRDLKAMARLAKANRLTDIDPKKLRSVTKKALREAAKTQPEVEFVALTDDAAKMNGQTRVVPTRWVETKQGTRERAVTEGRFEGCLVNDLINSAGRMLEGTAFRVTRAKGGVMVPTRVNPSKWEPYVSVGEMKRGKKKVEMMVVELPGSQGRYPTSLRRTMRKLSKAIPDVRYDEGSLNRRFYFEPRYFEAVREALGTVLLSPAASRRLSTHFTDLTKLNKAMASDNLSFYTPEAIGGFRKQVTTPGGKRSNLSFHAVQQRILARLEANDNRGVVGLGTGGGKTLIAIAMMQKLIRDGLQASPDNNGRFLYVCPEGHTGNVRAEVRKFLKQKDADFLLRHLDILEYPEFSKAERNNEYEGREFNPSEYVSLVFDEAQALKNDKWVATKSAYRVNHPRKILMTASVMDKADPREVYNLVQIANNVDMTNPAEARDHWRDRRKFENRYAERVGGVVVGPTDDAVALQEYEAWVNKNVQYIDKTSIPEAPLPPLTQETVRVKMDPSVEKAYRQKLHRLKVPMRGAIALHADGGKVKGKPELGRAARDKRSRTLLNGGHAQRVKLLDTLANTPWKILPRAGAESPKIEAAIGEVEKRLEETDSASRFVFFHEKDRDMLVANAVRMSEEFPGKIHAVCVRKEIRMFRDGEELDSYGGFELPFSQQAYRPDPKAEESADNPEYAASEWRQFVLDNVIKPDADVMTISCEAQQYGTGLNMQHAFDTVMHFDRVDAEKMNQRLGRVWRNGQIEPVKELTFDVVLSGRRNKYYTTLDDMRRQVQENQDRIFDAMILKPQEVELGSEWTDMDHRPASMIGLKRNIVDLLATPAAQGLRRPDFLNEDEEAAHA